MTQILIVDDSPTDVHSMRSVLEKGGYHVDVADTADKGLDRAREHRPDLILMDVVFDGMSGFQGTRKLARDPATRDIPVIIVSRKDQESDKVWGLRQGAIDYLVKPVEGRELLQSVESVLKGSPARS